jgi:quercetin dioxygenase-like cupin family protein
MKRVLSAASVAVTIVAAVVWATSLAQLSKKEIVGLTADEVRWFTPPYYHDGRQRARLFGDSSNDGTWIDRVKIPGGARVLAHTHPQDEVVTVIEGTWYLGEGARFDSAKLKGYPAGSFIVIPAGIPHFAAAKESTVVVQLSGIGKFLRGEVISWAGGPPFAVFERWGIKQPPAVEAQWAGGRDGVAAWTQFCICARY